MAIRFSSETFDKDVLGSSIPNFVFVRNGEVVDTVIGKISLDELREKLEAML